MAVARFVLVHGAFSGGWAWEPVTGPLEALGHTEAVVFGHDWGAVAAYLGALVAPHRIRKLVTAAVPYGPQFFRALATDYAQQRRSWYMMFFQLPVAEQALARDDFAMLDHLYHDWSPGWTWPAEEREAVTRRFYRREASRSTPGAGLGLALAAAAAKRHGGWLRLEDTPEGPVRMIGAGTLSQRLRSTPPSFNEIGWDGDNLTVRVRNLDEVPTPEMQIDDVPEDALPPREPGEPVAPVNQVPRTDPPVH